MLGAQGGNRYESFLRGETENVKPLPAVFAGASGRWRIWTARNLMGWWLSTFYAHPILKEF